MALIVLATIGFLACVSLVFVLDQWMRDTKRKAKTRPNVDCNVGETDEQRRAHVVAVPRGPWKGVIALRVRHTGCPGSQGDQAFVSLDTASASA